MKKGRGHYGGAKDAPAASGKAPTAAENAPTAAENAPTAAENAPAAAEKAAAAAEKAAAEKAPAAAEKAAAEKAAADANAVQGRFARHGIRADEKSTEIKKSIDKHLERNTWKSSMIILIGVVCNAIYLWTQGALVAPKDDASDADKLAHNQVVSFLNVSTIILTVFFIYRTYRTMEKVETVSKMGILDGVTMGALLTNNLLVIYSNLINEETGSPAFILIIVLLCIMLLLIGLNVYDPQNT
jgi:hypothetical protein